MEFNDFMIRSNYIRCATDHYCYIKHFELSYIILLLYVDDMLIAKADMKEINRLQEKLSDKFEMKDLRAFKQILSMSFTKKRTTWSLQLPQEKYIVKVLKNFSLGDAKAKSLPLETQSKFTGEQSPNIDA